MEYPRLGLPLALELVNTEFAVGGQPRDALQTPADLHAWLVLHAEHFDSRTLQIAPTQDDLVRFKALRAAWRRLFAAAAGGGGPNPPDVQMVNAASASAPRFERLDWTAADAPRSETITAVDGYAAALAAVAESGIGVLTSGTTVQQCQAPGCVLFFIQNTRRRHWCSAGCGNRARVARHYLRHRRPTDVA